VSAHDTSKHPEGTLIGHTEAGSDGSLPFDYLTLADFDQAKAGYKADYALSFHHTSQTRIIEAFLRLIEVQGVPFDKLSIAAVLKESGVARSTFYRHFTDKYDLSVKAFYYRAADKNLAGLTAADVLDAEDCHHLILAYCCEVQRQKNYLRRIDISAGTVFSFWGKQYLNAFFSFSDALAQRMGLKELPAPYQARLVQFLGGSFSLMGIWLDRNDCHTAPEIIAGAIAEAIPAFVSEL